MFLRTLAALSLALVTFCGTASAVPTTYDLTLTNTNPIGNVAGGTGSLTIDGSVLGIGNEFFSVLNGKLLALSFDIDGHNFDLADASNTGSQIFFQNGNLAGLTFLGTDNNILVSLTVGALSFTYSNFAAPYPFPFAQGILSATLRVDTPDNGGSTDIPEPAALLLFAAAVLGLGWQLRRGRLAARDGHAV
ncbi:PEP-CTERM sorting domain-containing protein [Oceanibacterium hippocampi]|uniref:Ice-binding protein C-terminal domain-containing protein n=1 Tax=Oceanibacterium hippocampi TaxID=745714 RepID=A0A1Y5S9S0_9PROT|nr:PEP-CTERM sorting domain-containing protein [Oceanibacterium hippocampi]SLN35430.1 hypothetical protein OCH7691_01414 [Oceanibacterium hippocampi]